MEFNLSKDCDDIEAPLVSIAIGGMDDGMGYWSPYFNVRYLREHLGVYNNYKIFEQVCLLSECLVLIKRYLCNMIIHFVLP